MDEQAQPTSESTWDYATGVQGLVRNRQSGRYYTRVQVAGKRLMRALKTKAWSVAKLRHADEMARAERQRQGRRRVEMGGALMGDLLDKHRNDYLADTARTDRSKASAKSTHNRLVRHWHECFGTDLREAKPQRIGLDQVRRFANYLHKEATYKTNNTRRPRFGYRPATVNLTVELLHRVLRIGVETGVLPFLPFELDPAVGGPVRKPERQKKLRLPASAKLQELFAEMRRIPEPLPANLLDMRVYLIDRANESADLAEFMAYSGARIGEARAFIWSDDLPASVILRGTKSEGSEDREVPKIPALRDLIRRIRARRSATGLAARGRVFRVKECREALTSACKRVGIERLTHHSLRHFFATICIEAGVDIPTVSRWLGHGDGGVLAMKTYGHLRREHSFAAAAKVTLPALAAC